jgi:hypothetical protein
MCLANALGATLSWQVDANPRASMTATLMYNGSNQGKKLLPWKWQ